MANKKKRNKNESQLQNEKFIQFTHMKLFCT